MSSAQGEYPAIRVVMMPRDTNPAGTIFGGVLLSYIDQAGAIEARKHTPRQVVTVAMDNVVFKEPVFVGDVLSFYTHLERIGRSSLTVRVLVDAERYADPGRVVHVTEARLTYVALDEQRRPTPVAGAPHKAPA
jgi:acyl-CoA thioesterase YciA